MATKKTEDTVKAALRSYAELAHFRPGCSDRWDTDEFIDFCELFTHSCGLMCVCLDAESVCCGTLFSACVLMNLEHALVIFFFTSCFHSQPIHLWHFTTYFLLQYASLLLGLVRVCFSDCVNYCELLKTSEHCWTEPESAGNLTSKGQASKWWSNRSQNCLGERTVIVEPSWYISDGPYHWLKLAYHKHNWHICYVF